MSTKVTISSQQGDESLTDYHLYHEIFEEPGTLYLSILDTNVDISVIEGTSSVTVKLTPDVVYSLFNDKILSLLEEFNND